MADISDFVGEPQKPIPHQERAHTMYAGSQYALPSDEMERERLGMQHNLLKRVWDNRLIFAPVNLSPGDRILDSGTGAGIWIMDVLATDAIPSTVLIQGLDIERNLFPLDNPTILSSLNARFCIGSVTALPPSWSSTFTFVHQRLLVAGLQASEWPTALSELHRVLVPGGWVQLFEFADWGAGPVTARHAALVRALYASRGLLFDCAARLPDMLRAAGFVNVSVDARRIPLGKWAGRDGVDARDDLAGVFRGFKTAALGAGGLGVVRDEAEFDALVDDVEEEWDGFGEGAYMELHLICAQKPSKSDSGDS